jgi:antitoxin component of MazEF toxin-antitoxin module
LAKRAYNVRMNTIKTTLTTSGNSVAVRLPKELLRMSGLTDTVILEVHDGQIIIRKADNPREGWSEKTNELLAKVGDPSGEFRDMTGSENDLARLPWNGLTHEEWRQNNA